MLPQLESIAVQNGFKGFSAVVLQKNKSMLNIFKKRYPHAKFNRATGGEINIIMDFENTTS
jgi:hypothetical protein